MIRKLIFKCLYNSMHGLHFIKIDWPQCQIMKWKFMVIQWWCEQANQNLCDFAFEVIVCAYACVSCINSPNRISKPKGKTATGKIERDHQRHFSERRLTFTYIAFYCVWSPLIQLMLLQASFYCYVRNDRRLSYRRWWEAVAAFYPHFYIVLRLVSY